MTKSEFSFLEKAYGLVYDPGAILWDDHCRVTVKFPDSIFWDWMHCLLASGGVAQYEVNQLLRTLVRSGVSLAQIDGFCSNVTTPSSRTNLTNTFFKDRVVDKDGSHIKAFASELLSATFCLGIFIDVVVRPTGVIPLHIACFDQLRQIVASLARGDETCQDIDRLKGNVAAHHVAFVALYPACVKPKLHYLKHTVECIEKFGCNLSCFGPERRHKDAKHVAAYSYNKASKQQVGLFESQHCFQFTSCRFRTSHFGMQRLFLRLPGGLCFTGDVSGFPLLKF